jgi:transcriptional repressor NrdR
MEKKMKEVETTEIGEIVTQRLKKLDTVAYIRFACVYRRFKDVDELMNEIHTVKEIDDEVYKN